MEMTKLCHDDPAGWNEGKLQLVIPDVIQTRLVLSQDTASNILSLSLSLSLSLYVCVPASFFDLCYFYAFFFPTLC